MFDLKVSRKTYKAPKWFVDLKKELDTGFETVIQNYGRSKSWWELAKPPARQEFMKGLSEEERKELTMVHDIANFGSRYAFARWIWENRDKVTSPELLKYNADKGTIVVESGLLSRLGEVAEAVAERLGIARGENG